VCAVGRRDEPATLALVKDGIGHGCDVCSRHRRGALYRLAAELQCTTLALGHTADDCAESLLRNILFKRADRVAAAGGRLAQGHVAPRPAAGVRDRGLTAAYTRARGLATVGCACSDKPSVRGEIRAFLTTLRARHPGVTDSVTAALAT